ncbi:MAG: Hemoglobin and hemoglobin-haptoglobin-binding protein [Herbaspirillum frisingense]|uniref:Hemoglobin and hemoglobin-haptoglobin-binding protein n=1 Tax=Herbaspirillum frisingense TaxID=92645 RepID=A0A7V8FYH5_9BURK|nr:MAG: Hemoglobin and hemoglobin-haptoglobin-binding protein [Herbaspirillum frisingense]
MARHPSGGSATPMRRRSVLRPLTLALAVNGALLCLAAPPVGAQENTASDSAPVPERNGKKLPDVEVQGVREEQHKPGASVKVTKDDLEKQGAGSFADVLKYQPLVSVPGVTAGTTNTNSAYDHPGSTNYNIRGVEGNRVGVDVDDVEMPEAVDRSATSGSGRASIGTFGQGRDFIDPEMYSEVQVDSGTTTSARPAGGIGGAVSFRTKSPEDYVNDAKPTYFGAKAGYNSADRSWNEGVTAAGASGMFDGLIVYSRRDGHQADNKSDTLNAYPSDWNSNALLLKGGMRVNAENKFSLSADLYRRTNDLSYDGWNNTGTAVTGKSGQHSTTARNTIQLGHLWTPANALLDKLDTRLSYQSTDMQDATSTRTLSSGAVENDYSRNSNKQFSLSSVASKKIGNNGLRFGVSASENKNEHQLTGTSLAKQPYPNTRTTRYGLFAEDEITFNLGGHRLAIIPGLRVDRVKSSVYDTGNFANSAITTAQLNTLYGAGSTNTIVSPSLSLVYDLQPKMSAYAQWKRGGRAPSVSETYGYWNSGGGFYALVGNPNLKKETSDAFDVGLKGELTEGIVFNSSLFYTKYKNFIAYTRYTRAANPEMFTNVQNNISTIFMAENRDSAYIYGLELSTRIDHGKFAPAMRGVYSTWALGYSQGKAKSRYSGDSYQDLDTVQPAKLIAGIGYDAPEKAWGSNLTGTFVKGKQAKATNRNSYANNGTALAGNTTVTYFDVPGYAAFDLTGYWRVAKNVRINAGINNLLDKRYWDYASVYSLEPGNAKDAQDIQLQTHTGRSFFASVNVDF